MDHGWVPLHGGQIGELTTQGLEDLDKRCAQYYKDGLRFAKWRSAFIIKGENVSTYIGVLEKKILSIAAHLVNPIQSD